MRYSYICEHGHVTVLERTIQEREEPVDCEVCESPAARIFGKPLIVIRNAGDWDNQGNRGKDTVR